MHITNHMKQNAWMAQKIIGMVHDDASDNGEYSPNMDDIPRLGGLDALCQLVKTHKVKRVYFTTPITTANSQTQTLQMELIDRDVDVFWVPDIFGLQITPPSMHEISGIPLYFLSTHPFAQSSRIGKWWMDKLLSMIALIILAPFMIFIAAAIKLTSPGPVLFHQERHGLNEHIFNMLKFRSMKVHSEATGKITQASHDDPRVTTVGRWLRASSMDELPQLINVLSGDMSLVGPRPHAKEHNEFYADKIGGYMSRHKVLPGLTGLAQVSGYRGETETMDKMAHRVEYDLVYINNWSLGLDVKIMFKTIHTLFSDYAY